MSREDHLSFSRLNACDFERNSRRWVVKIWRMVAPNQSQRMPWLIREGASLGGTSCIDSSRTNRCLLETKVLDTRWITGKSTIQAQPQTIQNCYIISWPEHVFCAGSLELFDLWICSGIWSCLPYKNMAIAKFRFVHQFVRPQKSGFTCKWTHSQRFSM